MERDPHDDLLLTKRGTTIVTQHTQAMDTMPDPYGSQEEEEALFSDVGGSDGAPRNKHRHAKNAHGVSNRAPGMWLEGPSDAVPASAPAAPAVQSQTKKILVLAGLGAVAFLLLRRA